MVELEFFEMEIGKNRNSRGERIDIIIGNK